jgi:hypothetical protein
VREDGSVAVNVTRKRKAIMVNVLSALKNFHVDGLNPEEMIMLSAFGKTLRSEFQNREFPVPEWLVDQLAALDREILSRRRDELERRLKDIKAQRSTLESASEKRERLDREQAELEKQLAGA